MDDDDESHDKGRKTNTERDFKPRFEPRKGYAPRGAMERPAASPSGPGGQKMRSKSSGYGRAQQPNTSQPIEKDSRPVFFEEKDQDVNREYQKTHRMISRDSPEHPDHKDYGKSQKQPDRPQVSQSDYAKAFRQAHGPMRSRQQSRTIEPE